MSDAHDAYKDCEEHGHVALDPVPDHLSAPEGWQVCGHCGTTYRYALEELDGVPVPDAATALYFVASVLEATGNACNPVPTAGGKRMCAIHKHLWPCPVQWTVTRQELVNALRQLGLERDEAGRR